MYLRMHIYTLSFTVSPLHFLPSMALFPHRCSVSCSSHPSPHSPFASSPSRFRVLASLASGHLSLRLILSLRTSIPPLAVLSISLLTGLSSSSLLSPQRIPDEPLILIFIGAANSRHFPSYSSHFPLILSLPPLFDLCGIPATHRKIRSSLLSNRI